MVNVKKLKELISEVKEDPRGLTTHEHAYSILKEIGLTVIVDADESEWCPYCGAEAEDSNTPLKSSDRQPYVLNPYIKVLSPYRKRIAEIRYTIPIQKHRAVGAPIFMVGANDLIRAIGKVLLGEKFEEPTSPYIGEGRDAQHRAARVVEQLNENMSEITAKALREED